MTISGAIKPKAYYPRFKWGSPTVTTDIVEPAVIAMTRNETGLRGQNIVASGKAEYLFGRIEEAAQLQLMCEQDQLAALRWFTRDWAGQGKQFQAWIDRFTGSCWLFENNLKDQNGLALTLNGGGSATYAATANGTGLTLSGSQYLTVPVAQASAGTPTGYDDPLSASEGVLVVDFKPSWNANDSTEHHIVDTAPDPPRILLYKLTTNVLNLQINDGAAGKFIGGTPSWISGDRVQIVGSWATDGTLALWYAVNGGSFTALTTGGGAGSGILPGTPTTLSIGGTTTGTFLGLGTYDTVAIFKRAFTNPQLNLASFRPLERNYFPYAELTTPVFQPQQIASARLIWIWPMAIRNGKA